MCNYVSLESCSSKCRCLIVCRKPFLPCSSSLIGCFYTLLFFTFFFSCSQLAAKCYYGPHLGRFCQICRLGMKYCISSEVLCGIPPWYSVYMTEFFLLHWNLRETSFLIEVSVSLTWAAAGKICSSLQPRPQCSHFLHSGSLFVQQRVRGSQWKPQSCVAIILILTMITENKIGNKVWRVCKLTALKPNSVSECFAWPLSPSATLADVLWQCWTNSPSIPLSNSCSWSCSDRPADVCWSVTTKYYVMGGWGGCW